jgi:hypothetical protein
MFVINRRPGQLLGNNFDERDHQEKKGKFTH